MIRKRKILIFIDWYLPGYMAGGPIRSCANLIEHLKEYFDFSVITRDTDYMSNEPYPDVQSNQWNTLSDGVRVFYFSSENLSKKNITSVLEKEEYDIVYLNGIFSRYFTLIPLQLLKKVPGKKIVIASRGMFAKSALSIKKWKKKLFLLVVKQFNLFSNVIFHATNEQEAADIIQALGHNSFVYIAPNLPEKNQPVEWKQKIKSQDHLKLVCIARVAPEKNIKYALEILKEVKANVEFDVFGPVYNKKYWMECQKIIETLPHNIKVNYNGSIDSKKVLETISRYNFLFLPTLGENFGHVILQAMNIGVPVIISDKTMWRNLEKKNAGWDIPLAKKETFISIIDNCGRMSQSEYNVLSKGAFEFAQSYMKNKESIEQNKQLFLK